MVSTGVHCGTATSRRHVGEHLMSRLLLCTLLLFTFTGVAKGVESSASVTSVRCDPSPEQGGCVNGDNVTITGQKLFSAHVVIGSTAEEQKAMACQDFKFTSGTDTDTDTDTITCTLVLEASAMDGVYPINLKDSAHATSIAAGSLAVGPLSEFHPKDYGFVDGWRGVQAGPEEMVRSFSASSLVAGDVWTVYGNFIPSDTYKVLFYSDVSMGMIACNNAEAVSPTVVQSKGETGFTNALQCTISSEPSVMGMFTLLVQNARTGAFLPGSTGLYRIDVSPPLPIVTDVSGACVDDSAACRDGATLQLTGSNFNTREARYNVISIVTTPAMADAAGLTSTDSGITCTPTAVSANSLTCTLSVPDGAVVGSYGIYAKVHVCTHNMISTTAAYVGNLMYGNAYGGMSVRGLSVGGMDMVDGNQVVASKLEGYLFTGGALALYGKFISTHKYTIAFFNAQAAGNGVPTCSTTEVQAYVLNCTGITQKLGNLGMYRVLVKDETAGYYLPGVTTTATPIMVFAPLPTFTAASGACAADSRKCVDGAELRFTAENLVVEKKIDITFDRAGLACKPSVVSQTTSVSCTLAVDASVPAGEYTMFVSVQGCAMGMMTPPNAAGKLVLTGGKGNQANGQVLTPGWQPTASAAQSAATTKSKTNVAAIVCAVIFAVLAAGFAVGFVIVTCMFCRAKKRQGAQSLNSFELAGVSQRSDPYGETKAVSAYNHEQ